MYRYLRIASAINCRQFIAVLVLFCAPFGLMSGAQAQQADDPFVIEQERLLAETEAQLAENPEDADALIWKGRRLGYLGRYEEAIEVYKIGATHHPEDARFPRHQGHRLISLRCINEAETVLRHAAALMSSRKNIIEPDGLPNGAGIPTSTLKGNIYYHLALAHYLQGDFDGAAAAWTGAAAIAANVDAASASRYWLYLSLMRAGREEAARAALAPVSLSWSLIENHDYHRLILCFKEMIGCSALLEDASNNSGVSSATVMYGLAAHALINEDCVKARALMEAIVAGDSSSSFGYIAAEADLAAVFSLDAQ